MFVTSHLLLMRLGFGGVSPRRVHPNVFSRLEMLTSKQYGEIVDIRFPSLKYDAHRRFCYVQFKLSSEAHAATQLDGKHVGDNLRLLAKISDPRHKQERQGATYEGRELYLANLDWNATLGEVKRAFSKYGTVEKVRIPKKVNGSSKGIGYVVFSNKVSIP